MLKSPTSIIFSFAFPLIFILAFTQLDPSSQARVYKIGLVDTQGIPSNITNALKNQQLLQIKDISTFDSAALLYQFKHQLLDAIVAPKISEKPEFKIIQTSLDKDQTNILNAILLQSIEGQYISAEAHKTLQIKSFKKIDYILPGQLGFALLAASVFGTAFLMYNLRNQLVLKRFIATPIRPITIILAHCVAKIKIQIASAVFILLVGRYFLDYTWIDGWFTFFQIIALCIFTLLTFLGYGFIIASIAKSESIIPPLANIVTLPQFILADTFLSIDRFPEWLQHISNIMPLTYFNAGVRALAFDGATLWDIRGSLLVLSIWGIVAIGIAVKTFKWE